MKVFISLAVFAFIAGVFALTDEQKAKGEQIAKECAEKNGISLDEAKKLREGDFSANNEKTQCFANCFLEQVGFIKDGQLQENVVLEKLSENVDKEKVQQVINACKDTRGANNCETAFKLFQCYASNKATLGN